MKIEDLAGFEKGGRFAKKTPAHPVFNTEYGYIDLGFWCANNEIEALELRFSVPASEWNEFQSEPFFQELVDRIESFRREIPETHIGSHEQKCTVEIPPCAENSNSPVSRKSFWGTVRKRFQRWKSP